MSSLRRPPIEVLFLFPFYLFLFLFVVCRSKTSFYLAGDPRSQEFRPGRRCEAGPAAPNRWRQAMTSLSCDAMPSTEGSAQPSTTLEVSSSRRARA